MYELTSVLVGVGGVGWGVAMSMCRCVDVSMCRCVDVLMCRCVDVSMC
jgi:hypothetical protein